MGEMKKEDHEYAFVPPFLENELEIWKEACEKFKEMGILEEIESLPEETKIRFVRGAESMKKRVKIINRITEYMKEYVEFRNKYEVDDIFSSKLEHLSELRDSLWPGKVLSKTKEFNFDNLEEREKTLMKENGKSYDYKRDRVVILMSLKEVDFNKAKVFTKETLIKHVTFGKELLMLKQQRKWKACCKVILIYDLKGLTMSSYYGAYKAGFTTVTQTFGKNYPEAVDKCFVVNAPRVFGWVFSALKPFIEPDTVLKVKILASEEEVNKAFEKEAINFETVPNTLTQKGVDNPPFEEILDEKIIEYAKLSTQKTIQDIYDHIQDFSTSF